MTSPRLDRLPPPYYDREGITIFLGDCRDIVPLLGPVDLVLTDPPYNAKDIGRRKTAVFSMPEEEYRLFCAKWFSLISHVERKVFTPGILNIWNYPRADWMLCWHKPGAVAYNALGNLNVWEPVLVYGKPVGRFPRDVYEVTPRNFDTGDHPCPKPLALYRWLVRGFSNEGDTILDPFLGSGTTARACKDLGRKCVGIEREEKYVEIAVKRLAQEVMSL